jgi:hypothetical protein
MGKGPFIIDMEIIDLNGASQKKRTIPLSLSQNALFFQLYHAVDLHPDIEKNHGMICMRLGKKNINVIVITSEFSIISSTDPETTKNISFAISPALYKYSSGAN